MIGVVPGFALEGTLGWHRDVSCIISKMVTFWGLKKWDSLCEVWDTSLLPPQRWSVLSLLKDEKWYLQAKNVPCESSRSLWGVTHCRKRCLVLHPGMPILLLRPLCCVVFKENGSTCDCHFWILVVCHCWKASSIWVLLLLCTWVTLEHIHALVSISSWIQTCSVYKREARTVCAKLLPSNQVFSDKSAWWFSDQTTEYNLNYST